MAKKYESPDAGVITLNASLICSSFDDTYGTENIIVEDEETI